MEIETMIAGSKNELNIMMVMPVIVVVMLRGMGSGMAGSNTAASVIVKIICMGGRSLILRSESPQISIAGMEDNQKDLSIRFLIRKI